MGIFYPKMEKERSSGRKEEKNIKKRNSSRKNRAALVSAEGEKDSGEGEGIRITLGGKKRANDDDPGKKDGGIGPIPCRKKRGSKGRKDSTRGGKSPKKALRGKMKVAKKGNL